MELTRRQAIDYLHDEKRYSRRLSAKIVDLALSHNDGPMFEALRKSLEKNVNKGKKPVKIKYVIKHGRLK